jgi:hypothetical protein
MMEPDSKYHKERRLAIARLRILMIEQTWEHNWERTLVVLLLSYTRSHASEYCPPDNRYHLGSDITLSPVDAESHIIAIKLGRC